MAKAFFAFAAFVLLSTAHAQTVREITLESIGSSAVCAEPTDVGALGFIFHSPAVKLTEDGIVISVSTSNYICKSVKNQMKWAVSGEMQRQFIIAEYWRDTKVMARRSDQALMRPSFGHRGNLEFPAKAIFSASDDQIIAQGGTVEKRFDLFLGHINEENRSVASRGHYWMVVEFEQEEARVKAFQLAR